MTARHQGGTTMATKAAFMTDAQRDALDAFIREHRPIHVTISYGELTGGIMTVTGVLRGDFTVSPCISVNPDGSRHATRSGYDLSHEDVERQVRQDLIERGAS